MDASQDIRRFLEPTTISQLKNMEIKARLIVEGFMTGLHKSPYHGFSVEFAEHRPYYPGDNLRHIDWKAYAKTGRFHVKQYEEETNLKQYVVLDTSSSMRYKHSSDLTKLEYGSYLAAALHFLMAKQRDATGLVGFDETVHTFIPPKSTQRHLRVLLAQLERINQDETPTKTSAAETLHRVAERISRRALVVVITDLFENIGEHDALLKALKHLRHKKHEVLVFHILESDTERKFNFPDIPMVFRDMETQEQITIQPAQFRENYADAVRTFSESFRRRCLEYNIDFVELDTGEPYDTALMNYIIKRKQFL